MYILRCAIPLEVDIQRMELDETYRRYSGISSGSPFTMKLCSSCAVCNIQKIYKEVRNIVFYFQNYDPKIILKQQVKSSKYRKQK